MSIEELTEKILFGSAEDIMTSLVPFSDKLLEYGDLKHGIDVMTYSILHQNNSVALEAQEIFAPLLKQEMYNLSELVNYSSSLVTNFYGKETRSATRIRAILNAFNSTGILQSNSDIIDTAMKLVRDDIDLTLTELIDVIIVSEPFASVPSISTLSAYHDDELRSLINQSNDGVSICYLFEKLDLYDRKKAKNILDIMSEQELKAVFERIKPIHFVYLLDAVYQVDPVAIEQMINQYFGVRTLLQLAERLGLKNMASLFDVLLKLKKEMVNELITKLGMPGFEYLYKESLGTTDGVTFLRKVYSMDSYLLDRVLGFLPHELLVETLVKIPDKLIVEDFVAFIYDYNQELGNRINSWLRY
ncbi:MAG: hypothetical protein KAR35_07070 [Candidatus Heimdallarchaeota archaeon]|nr:hypothetical protein [Candidatus Heimdallarchaeota archaeon]MCK5049120.1 hypothetical protein [Candidatus Heimdallarchaeota archaeon]